MSVCYGGCVCESLWVCMSKYASLCASLCYCEMRIICLFVYGLACVCGKCARVLSVSESEIVYVMCVCVRWYDSAGVRVCFVVCR